MSKASTRASEAGRVSSPSWPRVRRLLKLTGVLLLGLIGFFGVTWVLTLPPASARGVWISDTGANVLTIDRLTARYYSRTSVHCVQEDVFPTHMGLIKLVEGAELRHVAGGLELHVDGGLAPMIFKAGTLPPLCEEAEDSDDPRAVFDALWAAMEENYAFFDLYDVDWDARRELAPEPGVEMSDQELFTLLSETLTGLDDGHVQLYSSVGAFSPSENPAWVKDTVDGREDLWAIANQAAGMDLTDADRAEVSFGLSDQGIGYIQIREMSVDKGLRGTAFDVAQTIMADIKSQMTGAQAIVIDVRYNPGGDDMTAFGYASHFTSEPRDVLTKRSRTGDGWSPATTAMLPAASGTPFAQPVIVLTTELTGSGAEIFTMAMRELTQVTVMGGPTGGGLSDILGLQLPNGWTLGLSNQEYRTMDGAHYESVGVPPDVELPRSRDAILAGQDPILDAAFKAALGQVD